MRLTLMSSYMSSTPTSLPLLNRQLIMVRGMIVAATIAHAEPFQAAIMAAGLQQWK
jgi:hypothetical protein